MSEPAISELGEFLTAFAAAYEANDPAKITEFIYCPCIFFYQNDCVLLDTEEKISEFVKTILESYRASDCTPVKARLLNERQIGDRFALIDAEWSLENGVGQQISHYWSIYNLVLDEGRWKVAMMTRSFPFSTNPQRSSSG